jgi:UDP-N-acetylmuramoylalanine--D-glutamate ligase
MIDVAKTKFSILGSARSGIAAAYKIKEMSSKAFISEYKPESEISSAKQLKVDFNCEFGGHTKKIFDCNILIVSPGIPFDLPILKQARQEGVEIIGEIEFAYRIKAADSKIIAITGSNGKSTTVSLIHHILKTAGYNSVLGGNIGVAATSFPLQNPGIDFIVLELSSFQLELIKHFRADVAAILNITPDHLNRYTGMNEYAAAKFNIFSNQLPDDIAILNADDEFTNNYDYEVNSKLMHFSLEQKADIFLDNNNIIINNQKISIEKTTLKGPHNIANIMTSILALSPYQIPVKTIEEALYTFQPLAHRLEFIAKINDVAYYNDSKATNTDSVKYALQSFDKPIRIIMGGAGKGEDYTVLNSYLNKHAKKIYLIGDTRFEMEKAFANIIPLELFKDYEAMIKKVYSESEAGESVVLCPACTSYDMFKNFEERGNFFKELVQGLSK